MPVGKLLLARRLSWSRIVRMADEAQSEPQNTETNRVLAPEFVERIWKPGESGNPGGRPKKKPLTDAYAALLAKPIPNDKEGRTFAEAIAQAMIKEAIKGKVNAASEIADRAARVT